MKKMSHEHSAPPHMPPTMRRAAVSSVSIERSKELAAWLAQPLADSARLDQPSETKYVPGSEARAGAAQERSDSSPSDQ